MISVVTPSVRKEALEITRKCLQNQTFKDFEWLIGSPFDPEIIEAKWVVDDFKGGVWTFNRINNKLLKEAKGDIIVTIQDNIWFAPDTLARFKFWQDYLGPNWAVTGSGNIYSKLDEIGKPFVLCWEDPRRSSISREGSAYEVNPEDWEANFASAPKKMFEDIGGWDEKLDFTGFGMDQVSIVDRADIAGYRFWIDHNLECKGLKHERNKDWDKKHNMHGVYAKRRQEYLKTPVLNYL